MITLMPGSQFGRYILQDQLGRGGMATVYRATDTRLRRTVALKILAPQLSADPEFVRRFEREAILVANLRHPAIVTVYDIGEHDNLRYIAMEFIAGQSLNLVIREQGALDLSYAISLLEPLAQALDYAHQQGAVHRDVKPHNVMLATDGRVLLTDFGIAQASDSDRERITRTGIFMGTPEYISPEQAEGKRVDGRSDLYALGVVAYEILAGRVPFAGNTPQLIIAHIHSPPPPLHLATLGVPPETEAVVTRMLAKDPQQRYQTGSAFVAALYSIAQRHNITPASRSQLAALAASPSSAGKPTIVVNASGDTATAAAPAGLPPALAQPPQPAPPKPPAQPLPAYHEVGVRRSPSPPAPTQVQQVRRSAAAGAAKPTAKPAAQAQRGADPTVTLVLVVLFLLIAFTLIGYILSATIFRGDANSPSPPPPIVVPTTAPPTPVTPEAPPPPPPTPAPIVPPPVQPTATPREPTPEPPTRIPDLPTPEPTSEPPPPTATPEPPPTVLPLPTDTPEPPTSEPEPSPENTE